MPHRPLRYELVSRRAMLKATAGLGLAFVVPGCGNDDIDIFAGALTEPVAQPGLPAASDQPRAVPTTAPVDLPETEAAPTTEPPSSAASTTPPSPDPAVATPPVEAPPVDAPSVDPTAPPAPTATAAPTSTPIPSVAVVGDMVVSFTYTQGAGGKNERPYIAVWVENEAGELAETISLWYDQGRRGARWLDHLDRWWRVDQDRIAVGGVDDAATISSATREAGTYAVVWDGSIDGVSAGPGRYFLCIEAAREEGPHSLIREPIDLFGALAETPLPGTGELSAVSVRIDV